VVGTATPLARRMPAKSSDFHLAPLHKLLYTAARRSQDAGTFLLARRNWTKRRGLCMAGGASASPSDGARALLEGEENNQIP